MCDITENSGSTVFSNINNTSASNKLDINPPAIRIRDFGSKNGTYINGKKIGQRKENQTPEEGAKIKFPEYDLKHDDEIKLDSTVFVVGIESNSISQDTPNFPPANYDANHQKHYQTPQVVQALNVPNFLEYIKRLIALAAGGDKKLLAIRNFQIVKSLGKGGFGEVYLAQNKHSGNFFALKVMLPAVASHDWAVQMFMREIENTKVLRHKNIVKLFDYGCSENIFFFTMEYCEAGTVADLMKKYGGRLSADIALPIIIQVLDGLEYAHNAEIPNVKLRKGGFAKGVGLVHRDLKPSNIFLSYGKDELTAKIGDYGLAKAFDLAGLSGQTLTGNKGGTPVLMCRQQLLDYKYAKPEVDVWAAAACLYYMLTGYYPRNFTTSDPYLAVLQNDPVPIRHRNRNIPKQLAQIIDFALQEKPEIPVKKAVDLKQALLREFH